MDSFNNFFDLISKIPSLHIRVWDVIDIFLVAFVIYQCIKLIRDSRAFQLVKGLIFVGVIYFIVYEFEMQASTYILRVVFANIFIILVVVFQQEIRQIIEHIGKSRFGIFDSLLRGYKGGSSEEVNAAIIEICKAVDRMSESKTGALIVMEKDTLLGDVAENGTYLDAKISHELIGNIFYPKSPLHDGAAIVRGDRVLAAGCVLPNTQNKNLSSDLGTRHRAAVGMSEASDAMIVVVSEETGAISVAHNGSLTRNYTDAELRVKLMDYLTDKPAENKAKSLIKFTKGKKNEESTQSK